MCMSLCVVHCAVNKFEQKKERASICSGRFIILENLFSKTEEKSLIIIIHHIHKQLQYIVHMHSAPQQGHEYITLYMDSLFECYQRISDTGERFSHWRHHTQQQQQQQNVTKQKWSSSARTCFVSLMQMSEWSVHQIIRHVLRLGEFVLRCIPWNNYFPPGRKQRMTLDNVTFCCPLTKAYLFSYSHNIFTYST